MKTILEKVKGKLKLSWIEFDDASVAVGTLQSEYVLRKILDYRTIADLSFEILDRENNNYFGKSLRHFTCSVSRTKNNCLLLV